MDNQTKDAKKQAREEIVTDQRPNLGLLQNNTAQEGGTPMYNFWLAIEDRSSATLSKLLNTSQTQPQTQKNKLTNDLNLTWFPATGNSHRPFPTLLNAVQRSSVDLLFYESYHQPMPSSSLLRQLPTIISLDAAPLRSFVREKGRSMSSSFGTLLRGSDGRIAQQAAGFVVWSEWARHALVNNFAVAPERVLVARTGVDLAEWDASQEFFQIARRYQPGLPERIRVLFAGDDFEALGGDMLLDIFKNDPELAELCELHFITQRASAATHAESLNPGFKLHVHFHPSHEPAELYLNSDIYVLPARQPTSPSQLATALASGLPIVASQVDGLTELVRDGETGLLVRPGDAQSLRTALRHLADQPELRYELGQGSRRLAESEFNATHTNQQLLTFMRQVAAQERVRQMASPALPVRNLELEVGG